VISSPDMAGAKTARYFLALLLTLISGLSLVFIPAVRETPFLFFFLMVAVSARFLGFGPALFATFISAAIVHLYALTPQGAWALTGANAFRISSFIAVCTLIATLSRDRKQATEAAAESKKRLAAIVEHSEDAIFSETLEGKVTNWNRGAERLYGYTEREMLGRDIRLIFPPERRSEFPRVIEGLQRGEVVRQLDTVRIHKNGTPVHVSVSVSPVKSDNGEIIGASIIARDITAQKKAEIALRESNERFRTLADHAPVLIWMSGTDKLANFFNRGWLEFTGRQLEQELGNRWIEGIHPEDRQKTYDAYSKAFDARKPFTMEYRLMRWDGQYRWILDYALPRNVDRKFEGYIGSCVDITDRKVAEQAIRAAERRLQAAQLASNMGAWDWNVKTGELWWSEGIAPIHGYSNNDLQPSFENWVKCVAPEDRTVATRAVEDALAKRTTYTVTYRSLWPDGSVHWIEARGNVIVDELGVPQRMVGVGIDVTHRKRAEDELRDSEQRLRLAQEAASAGVWDWEISTGRTNWSEPYYHLYGLPASTPSSYETWRKMVHPEDRESVTQAIGNTLAMRRTEFELSYRITRRNGEVAWIADRARVFYSGSGEPLRMIGIAIDITQRKLAEDALRRSEKLAAAGRLAASIAHEINNPLEAVTNLLYLLRNHAGVDDSAKEYVLTAESELYRVSHIAKQTLGFYRDSSAPSPVRVSATAESVLELYGRKLRTKRIKVERDLDTRAEIRGFSGEIRQVFANLVANAIDAIPEGGTLKIRVAPGLYWGNGETGVRITVADSGVGIDAAHRERIFEPFYTTKKDVGTGLGLWVTRSIIEKHGGKIKVRSSTLAGRTGTLFSIFIPNYAVEYKAAASKAS
jgi:PAS domain S-box-containing protein